jgi:hypothetical protein
MTLDFEKLGTPSIEFEKLKIWIHGRQYPNENEYWDGNWLRVTVHYGAHGSSVSTGGAIIHLSEIERWYSGVKKILDTLQGEAGLYCMEPNLTVILKAKSLGHVGVELSITPDHMTQQHTYLFDLDQTYLQPLVQQCEEVLRDYPTRGTAPNKGKEEPL